MLQLDVLTSSEPGDIPAPFDAWQTVAPGGEPTRVLARAFPGDVLFKNFPAMHFYNMTLANSSIFMLFALLCLLLFLEKKKGNVMLDAQ